MIDYNKLSEEEQLEAVKNYGYVIRFIQNPSEELQLEAIKQDGFFVYYINNPSEELQLEAVKKNGLNIQYIINPSKEAQLESIKQCFYILNNIRYFIKNPCQEILDLLMIKDIIE